MTSARAELTPQMLKYAERFDDRGEIRWVPYLMYFHPADYHTDVVNTDPLGFRLSHGPSGEDASAGGNVPDAPVRLLAGSSTVFGIGATNDAATLPSRLWSKHAPSAPWLNFGGRSHNSTQELLLFALYRHLVPQVDEIVLFSGFNDLGLSRLPASMQGDNGAFFNCVEYFDAMATLSTRPKKASHGFGLGSRHHVPKPAPEPVPDLPEQIARAVELTTRHLATWRLLADGMGARLTYVLQPLATWIRDQPSREERRLFAELDAISDFGRVYGDIASRDSWRAYAAALREGCAAVGVPFVDMNSLLADAVDDDDWLFVDRIHFTDEGYDVVAALLAESLDLT